jgi:hypothetical protein
VWDAIEPLRPAIDKRVFAFIASREFARSDLMFLAKRKNKRSVERIYTTIGLVQLRDIVDFMHKTRLMVVHLSLYARFIRATRNKIPEAYSEYANTLPQRLMIPPKIVRNERPIAPRRILLRDRTSKF